MGPVTDQGHADFCWRLINAVSGATGIVGLPSLTTPSVAITDSYVSRGEHYGAFRIHQSTLAKTFHFSFLLPSVIESYCGFSACKVSV